LHASLEDDKCEAYEIKIIIIIIVEEKNFHAKYNISILFEIVSSSYIELII
jgi:hypothetical protein